MTELTIGMIEAFGKARSEAHGTPLNTHRWDEAGLTAFLAHLERDYDITPKKSSQVGGPKWNPFTDEYESTCVCGDVFAGATPADVDERVLRHLMRAQEVTS